MKGMFISMYSVVHVAISVTNYGESLNFYKMFGFSIIKEWKAEDLSIQIAHLKLNNMIIEIFCYKNYVIMPEKSKELSTDLPMIGVKHFAFGVPNLGEAYEDLLAKGIIKNNVKITIGRLGKKYFFIKDPDGILIEIIEL